MTTQAITHNLRGEFPVNMNHQHDEPMVDQGSILGYDITWNPDNGKFYASKNGETVKMYKDWRNMLQFLRKSKH